MDHALEAAFRIEMHKIYRDAYCICRHNATEFLRMLGEHGGYITAKRLLSQHGLQSGFERICMCGHPEITMEALILREPWRHHFSRREKEVAIARLQTFNYCFSHGELTDINDE